MKKKILFFGDSLTYGSNPDPKSKFGVGFSYVDILKEKFPSFEIIKEGQGGRTILSDDVREGRNGLKAFKQTLYSHFNINYIFIMLGINDLKNKFSLNEMQIAEQFKEYKSFIEEIKQDKYFDYKNTKVVLIAPPKIKENWIPKHWGDEFVITQNKSNNLAKEYFKITQGLGFDFINASGVKISPLDGVHLDDSGNRSLAKMIEAYLYDCKIIDQEKNIFNDWNILKQNIDNQKEISLEIKEGEVYWSYIGKNIGTECDGKGDRFLRPVFVLKVLSKNSLVILPLTTKNREGSWFLKVSMKHVDGKISNSIISVNQIKNIHINRIFSKMGDVYWRDILKIKVQLTKILDLNEKELP